MGLPSSQIATVWVQQELDSPSWILLKDVLFTTVRRKLVSFSEESVWEYVETNLQYVAEHLRDLIAECNVDGAIRTFEIDSEPSPYIRVIANLPSDVIAKLRRIDPFQLETICAKLLGVLGATSTETKRTNDGGIDFIGVNLKIVPLALTIPSACRAAVIGQAKRYKDGNPISETRLREFVGAATLKRHQLRIAPLVPVLFAFWTTSDFDPSAKRYARELGLWYMDGLTLATYVTDLGLKDLVMSLPDSPIYRAKPDTSQDEAEKLVVSGAPSL
jgi:Restriction endonuclease